MNHLGDPHTSAAQPSVRQFQSETSPLMYSVNINDSIILQCLRLISFMGAGAWSLLKN